MSYILDALRRADAERERGTVPGIHAQPTFAGPMPSASPPATTTWAWAGGAFMLALIVIAAGYAYISATRDVATAPPAVDRPSVATPAPTVVAAVPAEPGASAASAPSAPSPAAVAAPTATRAAEARTAKASLRKPKPVAPERAEPPTPSATTSADLRAPAPAKDRPAALATGATPATGAASTPRGVVAMRDLPDEIRRQVPQVKVGGSMYSPTAANRILIVNGQVLHEGDAVAPGVTLKQIKLKAAVLEFKGYRYEMTY